MKKTTNEQKSVMVGEEMTSMVRSVTQAYENIDNKIIYLLRSSSEDFLHLNTFFKNYYKESKTISENAGRIFEGVCQPRMKRLADDLTVYCSFIDKTLNVQRDNLDKENKILGQIERKQQSIFSPFNNLRQNVSSVKLLIAENTNSLENSQKANNTTLLNGLVEIQTILEQINRLFGQLKEIQDQLNVEIEKTSELADQTGAMLDNNLRSSSEHFISFLTWGKDNTENIYKLTKTINSSYGEIITNLQYQDIIRQKIEHIQQSHIELISELNQLRETELFHQTLCKIRDISGIQSAQLLHANKQYQMAVEVILNNFFELSESTATITELSQNIGRATKRNGQSPINEIITNIEDSSKLFEELILVNQNKNELLKQSRNLTQNISIHLERFNSIFQSIETNLKQFLDSKESPNTPQAEVIKSLSLFTDTKNFAVNTTELLVNMQLLTNELNNPYRSYEGDSNQENTVQNFQLKMPDILATLKADKTEILSLLVDLTQRYQSIKGEIQNAVKDIKYYSYFETTIEEIIVAMNQVNMLFDDDIKNREFSAREHLDNLKKKYTMNSEHLIHDQISQRIENDSDDDIFFDVEESKEKQEDDNLELF
jgi:hypothetical protein